MDNIKSKFSIKSWAKIAGGKLLLNSADHEEFSEICYDSRIIYNGEETLFIAIDSARNDGHRFIAAAYEKGVRNFLISQKAIEISFQDANLILVEDTLMALHQIAQAHRIQFPNHLISLTGSNGKTIVKEWLRKVLSTKAKTYGNPKSYNSQLGVPIALLGIKNEHQYAIIEAGISKPGEMAKLASLIQPETGIFTNLGSAHDENFNSQKEKLQEKLLLFKTCKNICFCIDQSSVKEAINKEYGHLNLYSWGVHPDASLRILSKNQSQGKTFIQARYQGKLLNLEIPFSDHASVENVMHIWLCALLFELENADIAQAIKQLQPIEMRMELKHAHNNCLLINDSYSADVESLKMALDFASAQQSHPSKTIILSDFQESGMQDDLLYAKIAQLCDQYKINRFIGIGINISRYKHLFTTENNFYDQVEDFLKNTSNANFRNELILLKGARSFKFEKIAEFLQSKNHETVLEINLNALVQNFNYYRSKLKPGVKTMAMVKAFAYGSGSYEIANTLSHHGIDYFSVAFLDEGITLREGGIKVPIMVMSSDVTQAEKLLQYNLEPEVYSLNLLQKLGEYLINNAVNKKLSIHLKLDTGMHRLGFLPEETEALIALLKKYEEWIAVKSIFSHLSSSGKSAYDNFTKQQIQLFTTLASKISSALVIQPMLHILNTSGITRFPDASFDMVRLGIGLYGIDDEFTEQHLKLVGKFTTTITQIKHLKKGESIGYNRNHILSRDSKIAIVAVGYADGLSRAAGNSNFSLTVHDQPAKILGNVCMDMCMIDITDIGQVEEGDTVIIFEHQKQIHNLASIMDTISYEVLTGISSRVKRIYFQE